MARSEPVCSGGGVGFGRPLGLTERRKQCNACTRGIAAPNAPGAGVSGLGSRSSLRSVTVGTT